MTSYLVIGRLGKARDSLPHGSVVKSLPAVQETWVRSPGWGRSPGEGHGNPLECSCLENPHGQRSLVGYSPWDRKESEMTEQLSTQVILHKPASLAKGLFSKLEGLN